VKIIIRFFGVSRSGTDCSALASLEAIQSAARLWADFALLREVKFGGAGTRLELLTSFDSVVKLIKKRFPEQFYLSDKAQYDDQGALVRWIIGLRRSLVTAILILNVSFEELVQLGSQLADLNQRLWNSVPDRVGLTSFVSCIECPEAMSEVHNAPSLIGRFAKASVFDLIDPSQVLHDIESRFIERLRSQDLPDGPTVSEQNGLLLAKWAQRNEPIEHSLDRRMKWIASLVP
jgi:hypothetical protein